VHVRCTAAVSALACALGAFAPASFANAAEPGLQLSVQPLVAQFQVQPGGQASTPVTIKNVGSEAASVVITPVDWRTLPNGEVKTMRAGGEGASSLDAYLHLAPLEFVLAPGETRSMVLSLVVPSSLPNAPRDLWGGYLVRAVPTGTMSASFGVAATVFAYDTIGPASRHVKLTDLHVTDGGEHAARMNARLVNDGRTYVRPQIHYMVAQSGRVVQNRDDSTPAVFAGDARSFGETLHDLAPGSYVLQVTIDYGGDSLIRATTEFAIR
jgi:hypothetical protein